MNTKTSNSTLDGLNLLSADQLKKTCKKHGLQFKSGITANQVYELMVQTGKVQVPNKLEKPSLYVVFPFSLFSKKKSE